METHFFDAERRVHRAIDDLERASVQRLQEFVRIPSPIGFEGDVQKAVASTMRQLGMQPDVFEIDREALMAVPGFNPTERSYAGRPCVVGVVKGTGGGRSLILNAHVDTALVENEKGWVHPPFGAVIEDGRLYGRGAWDDKAGLVEILLVVEALAKAGIRLKGDLIVKSVVEDETTGNGSLAALARGYVADGAIIVDGTWPERYIVSHLGQAWFRLTMRGRPAHAAVPGHNPIDAIGLLISALRELVVEKNRGRDTRWGDTDRPAFMNFGRVEGGAWPGAIPCFCAIEGTYGFPPPGTVAEAHEELRRAVEYVATLPAWPLEKPAELEYFGLEVEPVIGDGQNAVAQLLVSTIDRLHARPLTEHVVAGYCDLRHYVNKQWKPGIPACLYGPGGGKFAHVEDEYFLIEHLKLVSGNLASAVLSWCGVA